MALRVTQVSPGVHRLATRYENWYVLEQGGRLTVLDSGLPGHWGAFASALSRLGYAPSDVDAVLLTHHHPDHAGNAERMRSSGAKVFAHRDDWPYLQGEKELRRTDHVRFLWHPWYALYMLRALVRGITRAPAVAQLDAIADGEVVDVPGSPRILHAPGHTAGSCAVFLEEQSLLFTGDALVTLDMARGRTGPRLIPGPDTDDPARAVESLDVLAATGAEIVLPGHGEPWPHGVATAVEIARQPPAELGPPSAEAEPS